MTKNYVLQYTGAEIDNLLSKVKNIPEDVSTLKFEIVNELPTTDIDNSTIYLIKTEAEDYEEYIYINNNWELLGTTAVDLTGYATEDFVNTQIRAIEIPSVEGLASKQYVDTEVAKKVDANYVTNAIAQKTDKSYVDAELGKKANITQLNDLATESYVDTKIANLIDSAPETLNTLGEIAAAVKENDEIIDTLNAAIGTKANKSEIPSLEGYATENMVNQKIAETITGVLEAGY